MRRFACVASFLLLPILSPASVDLTSGTCLMVTARNISHGQADFFLHWFFSPNKEFKPSKGDLLEYDLFLAAGNPETTGGLDCDLRPEGINPWGAGTASMREAIFVDVSSARSKWQHICVPLDAIAERSIRRWNITFDGDKEGTYTQFLDNAFVRRTDGTSVSLYEKGEPRETGVARREGYSRRVVFGAVPRAEVVDHSEMGPFIDHWLARQELLGDATELKKELEGLQNVDGQTSSDLAGAVQKLTEMTSVSIEEQLDSPRFLAELHQITGPLRHLHERMTKYTGHLIGHAHIDFQWLWEWPETVQVCKDTFGQAVKFMDEFPEFTFTQSSSSLYEATEKAAPDIFRKIQQYVEKGQWELAGGRVCEGDTFMISPESHARHFLYGQRYFREKFDGRCAIVGWEPDTFGHAWTMPQVLKHGGCKYYYFCRGGHGTPLFWWEGPDGSRVLAFDEPVTGSWYNADVTYKQFQEAFEFEKNTGSRDMLWVYGVGNHGGGPTREHIETAKSWQERTYTPQVKFSTATQFFTALEKYDLTTIPVVRTEMNTRSHSGFFGVYTTHADIKRWNRDAEAATESAEAVAAFASKLGFEYPGAEFRRNWEEIAWNHHHDTLPGTSIHPSYDKSEAMYKRVIASSTAIGEKALAHIAAQTSGKSASVVVFNPLGWKLSGLVRIPLPQDTPKGEIVAVRGKNRHPIQRIANSATTTAPLGYGLFNAEDMPSLGYRRYEIASASKPEKMPVTVNAQATVLENAEYRVQIDPTRGVVSSIIDRKNEREIVAKGGSVNRMEVHMEAPNGMSAWVIGETTQVIALLDPVKLEVAERGPAKATVRWVRRYEGTDLVQTVSLPAKGAPEFGLDTKWNEKGNANKNCPFLKVAFDLAVTSPTMTYELPFGNIERPTDNTEVPALKWVDASDGKAGVALINDCKHGFSATTGTVRMSLIRSSYYPDAEPNNRPQKARWSLLPHKGSWKSAGVAREACEFNRPMLAVIAPDATTGKLPAELSFAGTSADNVIVTGVKKAEDSGDLVVRYYEAHGKQAQPGITTAFRESGRKMTNFIEDEVEGKPDATVKPYEIRTVKIAAGDLRRTR